VADVAAELGWTLREAKEHTLSELEAASAARARVFARDELMRLQTTTAAVAVAMDGRNKPMHQKWAKTLGELAKP
jgi:hypothetical protein